MPYILALLTFLSLDTAFAANECSTEDFVFPVDQRNLSTLKDLSTTTWIGGALYQVGIQCPDKVWPGFSVKKKFFVDSSPKGTFKWSFDDGALSMTSIEKPTLKRDSYFFEGEDTWGVKGSSSASGRFNLAVHEYFHNKVQRTTFNRESAPSRAVKGSDDYEAFYYRGMLLKSLRAAYENPKEKMSYLCQAKTWADKFSKLRPADIAKAKYFERIEGSAEYVEQRAGLIATNPKGCDASDEDLKQGHLSNTKESSFMSACPGCIGDGLVLPAYSLGSYAMHLLDESGTKNWQEQVAAGKAPSDILLESVKACDASNGKAYYVALAAAVPVRNLKDKYYINGVEKLVNDPDTVLIAVAQDSRTSEESVSMSGFFESENLPDLMIFKGATTRMKGEQFDISTDSATFLANVSSESPCGKKVTVFPVKKSELKQNGQGYKITNDSIKGSVTKGTQSTSNPKWLCVQ